MSRPVAPDRYRAPVNYDGRGYGRNTNVRLTPNGKAIAQAADDDVRASLIKRAKSAQKDVDRYDARLKSQATRSRPQKPPWQYTVGRSVHNHRGPIGGKSRPHVAGALGSWPGYSQQLGFPSMPVKLLPKQNRKGRQVQPPRTSASNSVPLGSRTATAAAEVLSIRVNKINMFAIFFRYLFLIPGPLKR
jgi:hypothetical protein